MQPIYLAIIEDEPLVRKSLYTYLTEHPSIDIQLMADSIEEFLQLLDGNPTAPSILLLDINLPGKTGIEGIPAIKAKLPELDIIMLTTFEESDKIFSALCAGACSYLSKRSSLKTIKETVLTVSQGGSFMSPSIARKIAEHFNPKKQSDKTSLTNRQQDIVRGLVDGLSYKMIAARHEISIDTVRTHIKHIYKALQINSKAELIRKSLDGEIT